MITRDKLEQRIAALEMAEKQRRDSMTTTAAVTDYIAPCYLPLHEDIKAEKHKLSQKNLASAVQRLTAQTGFWRDLTRRNLYLLASKMPFVPELLKLHSLLFKKSGISPKPSYPPPSKPSSPATLTRQRRSSSRASRNLTDAQKTYLVGRQYEAQKMTQGNHAECGSDGKYLSAQNGPQGISPRTVEIVAKEHGVGSNTVLRSTREPERKNKCPKMGHLKSELKAQRKKL